MTAVLPEILYRTKRGLCPGCGAPLSLAADVADVRCDFCGQAAVLERRLRKVEPEVPDAPLRLYLDGGTGATPKTSVDVATVKLAKPVKRHKQHKA